MKKLSTIIVLLALAIVSQAQVSRPKLIVGLVVDQMRWDYLYLYNDEFGSDGLKRLLADGFSFENTHINYAPTITAVGHSSIFSGSIPQSTALRATIFQITTSLSIAATTQPL